MQVENILLSLKNTAQRLFPVINKEKQLVGSIYVNDIVSALQQSDYHSGTAADIMQTKIITVSPGQTIDKAQEIMLNNNVDELVVVDDSETPDQLLGIITIADIIRIYNRKINLLKFGKERPDALPGDETLLKRLNLNKVLEKGLLTIDPEANLGDLVNLFVRARRNIFPVINKDRQYFGIVQLNDIRKLIFDVSKYETVIIKDIMTTAPEIINIDDRMEQVIKKFEKSKAWNLPVVDHQNRYVGIVSHSSLFASYRNQLLYQTEI